MDRWVGVMNPKGNFNPNIMKEALKSIESKITEIERQSFSSKCHLCGTLGELSKEHTPSSKAFNSSDGILYQIAQSVKHMDFIKWEGKKFQGGLSYEVLCQKCNNETGAWYNSEYLKFVRAIQSHSKNDESGSKVDVSLNFRPLRVAKQALVTLVASCQSGLLDVYPKLRHFLINKEANEEIEENIKLGLYLRANRNLIRTTGVSVVLDLDKKVARMLAEFSAWPAGWILTFEDVEIPGVLDVTSWLKYSYTEKVKLNISIPCQWVASSYPADFRKSISDSSNNL